MLRKRQMAWCRLLQAAAELYCHNSAIPFRSVRVWLGTSKLDMAVSGNGGGAPPHRQTVGLEATPLPAYPVAGVAVAMRDPPKTRAIVIRVSPEGDHGEAVMAFLPQTGLLLSASEA
jgi:hypothetical protein